MHGGFRPFVPVEKEALPWFIREEISNLFADGKWVLDAVNLGRIWLLKYQDGSRTESIYVTDIETLEAYSG